MLTLAPMVLFLSLHINPPLPSLHPSFPPYLPPSRELSLLSTLFPFFLRPFPPKQQTTESTAALIFKPSISWSTSTFPAPRAPTPIASVARPVGAQMALPFPSSTKTSQANGESLQRYKQHNLPLPPWREIPLSKAWVLAELQKPEQEQEQEQE